MGIYDAGRGRLVPQSVGTPKGTALVERVDRGDSSSVLNVFKGRPEGKLLWSGRSLHLSSMGSGDMAGVAMTATTGQSKSPSARTDQLRDAETSSKQPRETLADQNSAKSIADGQGVLKQQNPAIWLSSRKTGTSKAKSLWQWTSRRPGKNLCIIHPKRDATIANWIADGLLLGLEKAKGREWLKHSAGSNSQQSQVKATSDEPILYDALGAGNAPRVIDQSGELQRVLTYNGSRPCRNRAAQSRGHTTCRPSSRAPGWCRSVKQYRPAAS
mgnify:FL=1